MIIATRPSQKPSPSEMASVPVKTPVMFTFGANHTVNSRRADPYRLDSGIGLIPCVSIARSPVPAGILPPNDLAARPVFCSALIILTSRCPASH